MPPTLKKHAASPVAVTVAGALLPISISEGDETKSASASASGSALPGSGSSTPDLRRRRKRVRLQHDESDERERDAASIKTVSKGDNDNGESDEIIIDVESRSDLPEAKKRHTTVNSTTSTPTLPLGPLGGLPRSVSQTSFRRRQLHITKPIIILPPDASDQLIDEEARLGGDFSLSVEDFETYTAIGASFETDVSKGTNEFDVITHQTVPGLPQVRPNDSNPPRKTIKIPDFRDLDVDGGTEATGVGLRRKKFKLPTKFITSDNPCLASTHDSHDIRASSSGVVSFKPGVAKYDMDSEDEAFLHEYNKTRHPPMSDDRFEFLIDHFEHAAHSKRLLMEYPRYDTLKMVRIALDRLAIITDVAVRREKLKRSLLEVRAQLQQAECDSMRNVLVDNKLALESEQRAQPDACKVCFMAASACSPSLQMVKCSKCGVQVHLACYGPGAQSKAQSKTKGKWLCEWCCRHKMGEPSCILCPNTGGAVRRAKTGEWVHVACSLFMPGVHATLIGIGGTDSSTATTTPASSAVSTSTSSGFSISISDILPSRFGVQCVICGSEKGSVVCCDEEECDGVFHVSCAFRSGCHIRSLVDDVVSGIDVVDSKFLLDDGSAEEKQFSSFCMRHTPVDLPSFRAMGDTDTAADALSHSQAMDMDICPLRRLIGSTGGGGGHRRSIGAGGGVWLVDEETAMCSICNSGESFKGDSILFCDGCNLPVHQSCYGVPKIPEGDWFCDRCAAGAPRVHCALCPIKTGAFKRSAKGDWVHVVCALWMPGVYFEKPETMEDIRGVNSIDPARRRLTCFICRKKGGACVQCAERMCKDAMHVSCARRHGGTLLQMHEDEDGELSCLAYCKFHQENGQRLAAMRDFVKNKNKAKANPVPQTQAQTGQQGQGEGGKGDGEGEGEVQLSESSAADKATVVNSHSHKEVEDDRKDKIKNRNHHQSPESLEVKLYNAQCEWDKQNLHNVSIDKVAKAVHLSTKTVHTAFKYWLQKRLRWGRPLLDRYQHQYARHDAVM